MKRAPVQPNEWVELELSSPHDCPYLPGRQARLAPGIIVPDGATFDGRLAAGYRRLGAVMYRPACAGCAECVPLRVPLATFAPSKSQRRLWRRLAARYRVRLTSPRMCDEHFELYLRHALHVSEDNALLTPESYEQSFVFSLVRTRFIEYRVDGELVALSVLDEGARGLSSVYVSWEPRFEKLSPGTFSALWEMQWGLAHGKDHYYLGYWVADCPRMAYKARFSPHERMGWDDGEWRAR